MSQSLVSQTVPRCLKAPQPAPRGAQGESTSAPVGAAWGDSQYQCGIVYIPLIFYIPFDTLCLCKAGFSGVVWI